MEEVVTTKDKTEEGKQDKTGEKDESEDYSTGYREERGTEQGMVSRGTEINQYMAG